ncbi:hypothetical protein ACFRMN_26635 [Streptomyces sp. NPDC056835]|uniref:hypothetical protein n=1 Tax=Streptomyces sp. NPDC056835 TaxID=3345956 RepID=UPI00368C5155
MSHAGFAPSADYAAAVDSLAGQILDALRNVKHVQGLAVHVARAADTHAALAAVRVLGPDVFAPALLTGIPFGPADREVVAEALRVFPLSPDDPPEAVLLGRATATLLARCEGTSAAVPDRGAARPGPVAGSGPVEAADGVTAASDLSVRDLSVRDLSVVETEGDWRAWAQWMARLSPLALPDLAGPVSERAADRTLDLSRGLTRSMLRRDYPTAARLARWIALAPGEVAVPGMDIAAVVTHLELCGATGVRTVVNTAIARLLIAEHQQRKEHGT